MPFFTMESKVLDAFHRTTNSKPAKAAENHKCDNTCMLWEYRPLKAFVCVKSRKIHWCGERCDCRVTTIADEVCSMTGLVLDRAPEQYQPVFSKSRNRITQRVQIRQCGPSMAVARSGRVTRWVSKAVHALLTSPKRRALTRNHIHRAEEKAAKVLRGPATFRKLQVAVALVCIRAGPSLQPAADPNTYTLHILKERLTKYILAFPNLKHTERTVTAFTAACLQRLATGLVLEGVVLFHRSPFVAAHVPAEISHTELCDIPCRQVSAAHRLLITELVGPTGLPKADMAFT